MKACGLFYPIFRYLLFQRVFHFDERFNSTLSPSPLINFHVEDIFILPTIGSYSKIYLEKEMTIESGRKK
jgi:hypothetical protein